LSGSAAATQKAVAIANAHTYIIQDRMVGILGGRGLILNERKQ